MKLWRKLFSLLLVVAYSFSYQAAPHANAASSPQISNVSILTPQLAAFDHFEAQFDLKTVAINYHLPYDSTLVPGMDTGQGVSVDALFSPDNWATVYTQPAFYYQPYRYQARDGKDHLIPDGSPHWLVRFTPQTEGNWQFRLRATDAGGTIQEPSGQAFSFRVAGTSQNPNRRRGFLRVSSTDSRYFEFQNGQPFLGLGYNTGLDTLVAAEKKLALFQQNKIDFTRIWMSGKSMNGSQWTSWASHHLSQDGYLPAVSLDIQNTYSGADVSLRLDDANPCLFTDFWQGGVPVKPNTTYVVEAKVKLDGVSSPLQNGDYGFVIKQGSWLGTACVNANPGKETLVTGFVQGSTDWMEVSGTIHTTANQYWVDNLYLVRQNAAGGQVYIDSVHVYEQGDPNQVELLREPFANSHLYFDPINAALWDRYFSLAEDYGVYIKLVIDEKNEWIRNRLGKDGVMASSGDNNNFYAAEGTKVRWLQQAWWRYIIARWGSSQAIHSFEYINEGDPYNGNHYNVTKDMADYFKANDPARHLVTTSFWASFPNQQFWSNPAYQAVDYADIHAYISTGWGQTASFLDDFPAETDPQNVYSGNASARIEGTFNKSEGLTPRGLVIREKGEWIVRYWMKAQNFSASCSYGSTGGTQRLRWSLDSGAAQGVVPSSQDGKDFLCTSPAGTFDWRSFRSDQDREGRTVPVQYRLLVPDDNPHEISLRLENSAGTGGTAWIDAVELVSPSGKVVPVLGSFDVTPMDEDTAWYHYAYSNLYGANSPAGVSKPLVRGETGVDFRDNQSWQPDLNRDHEGVWLHNMVWAQISPGGMYDMLWWGAETIDENVKTGRTPGIHFQFKRFARFMEGIPINNGYYEDAAAKTSNPELRAWGQKDKINGRAHLWIQNQQHTWRKVVDGAVIPSVIGTVSLNMPPGIYHLQWWNTTADSSPVFLEENLSTHGSTLTVSLPAALKTDVGLKIELVSADHSNTDTQQIYLPHVVR